LQYFFRGRATASGIWPNHAKDITPVGEIVNLNRYRKSLAKRKREKEAQVNRAKHGRTRSERSKERDETARRAEELDEKKLD